MVKPPDRLPSPRRCVLPSVPAVSRNLISVQLFILIINVHQTEQSGGRQLSPSRSFMRLPGIRWKSHAVTWSVWLRVNVLPSPFFLNNQKSNRSPPAFTRGEAGIKNP